MWSMTSAADDPAGEEHRRRLAAADKRIYSHPAYIEHEEVEALAQAIGGVLIPNGNELLGLLAAAATNEDLAIELVQEASTRQPFHDEFQARTVHTLTITLRAVPVSLTTFGD